MKTKQYKVKLVTNVEVQFYEWLPDEDNQIKAVLQIAHGMAEHCARYYDFAAFMVKNGFAVYGNDHRGHGKTVKDDSELGFFANDNGWNLVVEDLKAVTRYIRDKHQQVPFFILGHSMGSFLVRTYIMKPPIELSGVILSGTAGSPGFMGKVGLFMTKVIMLFNKNNSTSNLMNSLSFGEYNKQFKPTRTDFDWLSRDEHEVDKYKDDPLCGYVFTIKAFNDMIGGLLYAGDQKNIDKTPRDLPICMIAGTDDPVGENGKGVKEVYGKYSNAGIKNITLELFEGCRHEILNEINKKEVYDYILNWCNSVINK